MSLIPTFRSLDETLRSRSDASAWNTDAARETLAEHARKQHPTPWYIALLSGAGAWFAASFFLAFLGCVGILDSPWVAMTFGVPVAAGGMIVRRLDLGAFVDQLGLAFAILGPAMLTYGVAETSSSVVVAAGVLLAFSFVSVAFGPDDLVAFLLTLTMVFAGWFLVMQPSTRSLGAGALLVVIVGVHGAFLAGEANLSSHVGRLVRPVTNGLFIAALALLTSHGLARSFGWTSQTTLTKALDFVLVGGLVAIAVVTATFAIRSSQTTRRAEATALAAAFFLVLGVATFRTPALVGATGLVVLAFHLRRPMLVAFAFAITALAGGHFYYELRLTLLQKSFILIMSGALFLAARQVVAFRFPRAPHDVAKEPA